MALISHWAVGLKSRLGKQLFAGMLGLFLVQGAMAQTPAPIFQNLSDIHYYDPGSPFPPTINATNFDNEALFSINFSTYSTKPAVWFEPNYILNYTNNGTMTVNNPLTLNGVILSLYSVGFKFDQGQNNGGAMAGTFYNQGTIRADSIIDSNNVYSIDGIELYEILGEGQCLVNATNIIDPGDIDVSVDGSIQLTGQNVNLSSGVFNIEALQNVTQTIFGSALYNSVNFSSTGAVGTDTNGDWDPGVDLNPGFALSSFVPIPTYYLQLNNSTSYFDVKGQGTSNVIYRSVFVQNNSQNVPYNVYIDPPGAVNYSIEPGAAHVEWVGTSVNPATGVATTNYLYLTDDYAFGASTNVAVIGGVPDNFSFITSATPLFANPTPAGFENVFAVGSITNPYAYMNGQIVPSDVVTNVTPTNPHGTITNLPSRILISASKDLNLHNSVIGGENYLSLMATNQFDGSAGAQIAAPFSDISLGVTNGTLRFTNLLESAIPDWSGTIQAWSTRWVVVDPTTGITNDFRVLLVFSQLVPTTVPWVNSLKLYTATNLVISDVLNVYGSFFTTAQKLLVTTNGVGFGATSAQGELNADYPVNLGPAQWPNLRWITNNGVISSEGTITFTNANNYVSFINNGLISDAGTTISTTNFLNSGTITNLGTGNFLLQAQNTTLTNGAIYSGGGISISSQNILASNVLLQCQSLTLNPINSITDSNVVGNIWVVGSTNFTGGSGFALTNNPVNGDLRGTTITNICPPPNKQVADVWAGRNFGAINGGYTNNVALGHLVLNAVGANSSFSFTGTGTNNALYVDCLEFQGALTNGVYNNYDFSTWLTINTNIVIYFAQAFIGGVSVAEAIDAASVYSGENGGSINPTNGMVTPGRLRWVPTYAGLFSSTNIVTSGVTNTYNTALTESQDIDSNGNGLANADDPSPFFTSQQINFTLSVTNQPSRRALLAWNTVPLATNYVYYTSSLLTNNWQLYTNFISTSTLGSSYVVTTTDTNILKGIRFYKVLVQPWLLYPY